MVPSRFQMLAVTFEERFKRCCHDFLSEALGHREGEGGQG